MENLEQNAENNQAENQEKPKVVKKRTLPTKDIEMGAVASLASAKWTANAWLTLLWLTSANFATMVANFNAVIRLKNQSSGIKKGVSKSVVLINDEIAEALVYVKAYILEKFKKDRATSMYPLFGIYNVKGGYSMPEDFEGRKEALEVMILGIKDHFTDKEYGLEFWTDIKNRYDELANEAGALSSAISVSVGDKKQLRKDVKLGLNAIIKSIQANYPHTWKEELRNWGLQKERY